MLIFPAGTTRLEVPVTIIRSVNAENTERFGLTLEDPTNAMLGSGFSLSQVTITDSDRYTITFEAGNAIEGQHIPVNLRMTGKSEYDFTVVVMAHTEQAEVGVDLPHYSQSIRFDPLQLERNIEIPTTDDDEAEGFERVRLDLRQNGSRINMPYSGGSPATTYAWIIDNDSEPDPEPPSFHITSEVGNTKARLKSKVVFAENNSTDNPNINIWLTHPPTKPVTVTLKTSGDDNIILERRSLTHTFTTEDWGPYTIAVEPRADDDAISGVRTVSYFMTTEDPVYRKFSRRLGSTTFVELEPDTDPNGRKTVSQTHQGVSGDLTLGLNPKTTSRHTGSSFWALLNFSSPIKTSYKYLRNSLEVHNGSVGRTLRINGQSNRWAIEVKPFKPNKRTHLIVHGNRACNQKGAICARGGTKLKNTFVVSIAPPGVSVELPAGYGPKPILYASEQSVNENTGTLEFNITISKAAQEDVSFDIMATNSTVEGQALETKNYRGLYETVTIPEGQTSYTVSVEIINDDDVEGDETFYMFLHNADGLEFDGHPDFNKSMLVDITIIDDD